MSTVKCAFKVGRLLEKRQTIAIFYQCKTQIYEVATEFLVLSIWL